MQRKLAEAGEALRVAETRNKQQSDELAAMHAARHDVANLNNTVATLRAEQKHNAERVKSLEAQLQVKKRQTK